MSKNISPMEKLRNSDPRLHKQIAGSQYEVMEMLNKRIGQVKIGGKVRFVDLEDETLVFYSKADMATILAHESVLNVEGKDIPAFRWWLAKHDRRQYSCVVFEPDLNKAPVGSLNLFRGFKIAPKAKKGGWDRFGHHLFQNVCAGDMACYQYLLDFFAHLFQRPGQKIGVAVILFGDKGSGKSIVSDVLAECIGPEYCPVVDTPEGLTGKHNNHLAKAVLIRVEEALHAKDPRHESRLKHMITGGRFLIEPKGVDAFEIDSKANLIFTTNKKHSVPATGGERRFFCLHVGNGNKKDRPYFAALLEQMKDGGYAAFVADMMTRDIRNRDLGAPPVTTLLSTQIVESMTGLEKWWCATLAIGRLPFLSDQDARDAELEWPESGNWIVPKSTIHASASAYARDFSGPPTPEAVGKFLAANVPGLTRSRRQTGGDREHLYCVPSLEECRHAFVDAREGLLLEHVTDMIPDADQAAASATASAGTRRVVPFPPRGSAQYRGPIEPARPLQRARRG